MKTNLTRSQTSRRAFTLVELIVVLMILVGLAAVLIPAITDMVARTNRSTSASNIAEVAGAIQRYEAQYLAYPDKFDSLMTDLDAPVALNTLLGGLTSMVENVQVNAARVTTLNNAGITTLGRHTANDNTFDVPTLYVLLADDYLHGLTTAAQEALGLETSVTAAAGKYVVLGIGTLSDMNGKTMFDAPVHFPRDTASNPDSKYCRFIAVFQITDGSAPISRAKLVAVLAPDGSALNNELSNYFQIASNF